jgi:hypothetical protein
MVLSGTNVFSRNNFINGTTVYAVVEADGGCFTKPIDTSNRITIVNQPHSPTPKISLINNLLVADVPSPVEWYGPNGYIPNVTANFYWPHKTGDYYAVSTQFQYCPSEPSNVLNVILNLGIADYDMSRVSIYPNPTRGDVHINWHGNIQHNMLIELYSLNGQLINTYKVENVSSYSFNVANLASGQYILKLTDADGHIGISKLTVE